MSRSGPSAESDDRRGLFEQSVHALRNGKADMAVRCADQLLAAHSNDLEVAVWAVRVRLVARRFDDAVSVGCSLLQKMPNAELSGIVGHAYQALGQFGEAAKCFQVASEGQPTCVAWQYHRAAALLELRRHFEALLCLQEAVRLGQEPSAMLQLADLELRFEGAERALSLADEVTRANPVDASAHSVAARALMQLSRKDDADRRWDMALLPAQSRKLVVNARSRALIQYGDFERAAQEAKVRMEQAPDDPLGYIQFSLASKFKVEDRPAIERMERLAKAPGLDDETRSAIEYAIGKAYDGLREFEHAIPHFDAANEIEHRKIARIGGFYPEGYAANMALRREAFNGETIRRLSEDGNPTELPIFVLGMIRSGTTLAEQILSVHPMVRGAGELDHWLGVDSELIDAMRRVRPDVLHEQASLYLEVLRRFSKSSERVVDKQPGNLILAGPLHAAFPNARIIHMRRNPADTALSIWTTPMATSAPFVNNRANIVFAYREYEKLMAHWRAILPSDRFLEVEYEALVSDREAVTRRMVEFCGLPWSDECLHPEQNQRSVATPSLWQVRQPVYHTSIGRWKNYEPWLGEFRELL